MMTSPSYFSKMDQDLAMHDLEPHLSNKAIRVTTAMAIQVVPIVQQDDWVKRKLIGNAENGEYWKTVFERATRSELELRPASQP